MAEAAADILVRVLRAWDVQLVFGLPGDGINGVMEALRKREEEIRFVQVTPPGSACSIAFGLGISPMAPGSLQALQVVVADIEQAHTDLTARGVDVSPIDDQPWGRFVRFADPDGNSWTVQQPPVRSG